MVVSVIMTKCLRQSTQRWKRFILACGFRGSQHSQLALLFLGCGEAEDHGGRVRMCNCAYFIVTGEQGAEESAKASSFAPFGSLWAPSLLDSAAYIQDAFSLLSQSSLGMPS